MIRYKGLVIRRDLLTRLLCSRKGQQMNSNERRSEPHEIYDILAEIVADLKPGKDKSIDDIRTILRPLYTTARVGNYERQRVLYYYFMSDY